MVYLVLLVNGGTSASNLILTNQNSAEYAIKKIQKGPFCSILTINTKGIFFSDLSFLSLN